MTPPPDELRATLLELRATTLAVLTTPRSVALLALLWVAAVSFAWFAWSVADSWL